MIVDRTTTALVVDSTCDLPDSLANDPSITIVPLTVYFGEEARLDWVDLKPEEFYERLVNGPVLPRTSQPSAGAFLEVYQKLRETHERVYSVHLSSKLSGTMASAEVAASQIDGIRVVDSELATGGFALLVARLLAKIDEGTPEDEFEAYIAKFQKEKTFFFLPTTLEFLYKGGRIGKASHLMGTLLNIKPVLIIDEGIIDVYKKVRGLTQALEVMRDGLLERTAPGSTVYYSLAHGLNESVLNQLAALIGEIKDRDLRFTGTSVVGPVIGTYVGPAAVALGFIQE